MRQRESGNLLAASERSDWRVYGADGAAALLGGKRRASKRRASVEEDRRKGRPRGEPRVDVEREG